MYVSLDRVPNRRPPGGGDYNGDKRDIRRYRDRVHLSTMTTYLWIADAGSHTYLNGAEAPYRIFSVVRNILIGAYACLLEIRPGGWFRPGREIGVLPSVQRRPFFKRAEGVLSNECLAGPASSLRGRGVPVLSRVTPKGPSAVARAHRPPSRGDGQYPRQVHGTFSREGSVALARS